MNKNYRKVRPALPTVNHQTCDKCILQATSCQKTTVVIFNPKKKINIIHQKIYHTLPTPKNLWKCIKWFIQWLCGSSFFIVSAAHPHLLHEFLPDLLSSFHVYLVLRWSLSHTHSTSNMHTICHYWGHYHMPYVILLKKRKTACLHTN